MNRREKEQMIESLQNDFQTSAASFLVGYKGLTVSQLADLRGQLRKEKARMQVTKVTLMKRAVAEVDDVKGLDPLLGDQVALVFASNEVPSVAKILCDFSKENEQLSVLGGCFETSVLDSQSVKSIASLPSREVLLAQLCGVLNAPVAKFAGVLNAILTKPVRALKEIEKKKASS